jgi:hypothetical protein
MSTKPKYTVEPGRGIARDGVEILAVVRSNMADGSFPIRPSEADEYVHRIVHALNVMPEMLEALKKAEHGMYYDSENNVPDAVSYDEWYDAMQAVRAAIAKAEGK